jgi:outer membrane protein
MGKIYNAVLVFLVASVITLFVLFFTTIKTNNNNKISGPRNDGTTLPIAYFDVDTLISQYEFSKQRQAELELVLQKANDEINRMNLVFESKQRALEIMQPSEQKDAAMIELNKLRQENSNKEEVARQNLQTAQQRFQVELRKNLQDFITIYNTPQKFSFIINDEPGFIFYRDSALNITNDLIKGLNKMYNK